MTVLLISKTSLCWSLLVCSSRNSRNILDSLESLGAPSRERFSNDLDAEKCSWELGNDRKHHQEKLLSRTSSQKNKAGAEKHMEDRTKRNEVITCSHCVTQPKSDGLPPKIKFP